jgi:hypothetical protein
MEIFKIGIIGSLKPNFDIEDAKEKIVESIELVLNYHPDKKYKIVSVMTNDGIPKHAYDIGKDKYKFDTVGYASKMIYQGKYGVYPVDEQEIVGEKYGDECDFLINNIDCLIRIGGGYQSNFEVEQFKSLLLKNNKNINLNHYIIEKEINWQKNN